MRPGRIVALILGLLLIAPGIGMLFGGAGLMTLATQRDDAGFTSATIPVATSTAAITTENMTFQVDPGTPQWLDDALVGEVRIAVADASEDVFVGIGPRVAVDAWLAEVGHDQIEQIRPTTDGWGVTYDNFPGTSAAPPPAGEQFWVAAATGPDGAQLRWQATNGQWTAVVMNSDGSPGVVADVEVGLQTGFLVPVGLTLSGLGLLALIAAVALVIFGATGPRRDDRDTTAVGHGAATPTTAPSAASPVSLQARLDPALSRWMWLVKWVLAIPHFVVLAALWLAFVVLTVVAGVSILFTGTYPRGIFDFNVGVLRWSWRVSYYATTGGIGTDHYPPFSLAPDPDYPAGFDVAYPERLSRGLVLVKWWLLALPQYLVLAILVGTIRWVPADGANLRFDPAGGGGVLGLLVLFAGIVLLVAGSYPRPLFDLVIGLNRWVFRVVAYAALMTDRYPPFRLDAGGEEPVPTDPAPPPPAPTTTRSEPTKVQA